jgi:hypothetical protein
MRICRELLLELLRVVTQISGKIWDGSLILKGV